MRIFPLLLLVACGDPTLYPKWGGDMGAAGPDTPVDTGSLQSVALVCGRADEGTVAQLTVVNEGSEAYELYTVDDTCNHVYVTTLAAGSLYETTVGNHLMWAVYAPGARLVAVFGLPSGSGVQWVEYIP